MTLTADELRDAVARCRAGLAALGVGRGDRVAAYLPNVPETIVAFLATASLGAVWSSCAPEFGVRAVVDRLSQVEPRVLLTVDGYRYGDRDIDRAGEVAAVRDALPGLEAVVVVPYLRDEAGAPRAVPGAIAWHALLGDPGTPPPPLAFERVPFDHPLYILFSSGTTGLPKAIVHGTGGILLEHCKALALHTDLGPDDRFCWYTTTGWMMWNYLVSGLAVGSTLVLFDGNPAWPDLRTLWQLASDERVTYLGLAAPFLMACRAAGLTPGDDPALDLGPLRGVGSTGAPLPAAGFHWVADAVKPGIPVGSLSGGTDLCTGLPRSLAARAGVGGRDQLPDARRTGGGVRRRWPARSSAGRVSSSSRRRCRRCRWRSGATRTARACGPRTSSASPACGATATG